MHWKTDVQPVIQARCVSCHSGEAAAAGYDMYTYNGVLGGGSDATPNAIAGEPASAVLEAVRPGLAAGPHATLSDVHALLEEWTVQCRLSYSGFGVHEAGIANPADEQFHGRKLRGSSWDFESCRRCHGADDRGGNAQASCYACHSEGPTGCSTCHQEKKLSGAHTVHRVAPSTASPTACQECHTVPADWRAANHVFLADGGEDKSPAEVRFGSRAAADVHPQGRSAPPTWDGAGCSNVACHGDTLGDSTVHDRTFVWQAPAETTACVRCHGAPPSTHPHERQCVECHEQVVNAAGALVQPLLHINARIEVGPADGNCTACHQDVPFKDSLGANNPMQRPAGAHNAHLQAPNRMSGVARCADCHLMPGNVASPGHLDSDRPAEVFVWEPTQRGLAAARGAVPAFDPASGGCASTYCHGGGEGALRDGAPNIVRAVSWTGVGAGQVYCGSCHGIPPVDTNHDDSMTSLTCSGCHPQSVDTFGRIIINAGGTSRHVNGVVDVTR